MPKQTKENKKSYMVAYTDAIEAAAQTIHKPSSFKLFLYFLSNQDNYNFALSTKDFSERYGVSTDSAKTAVNELIELGYLVNAKGNKYEFYEQPQDTEELIPTEEIKKRFTGKNGVEKEFTFAELEAKVGKEKAKELWEVTK